jgi:hypothetical protein
VAAKERTGLRHFFNNKPDSNYKTIQKYVPVILKTYDLSTGYTFNPGFSRRNTSLIFDTSVILIFDTLKYIFNFRLLLWEIFFVLAIRYPGRQGAQEIYQRLCAASKRYDSIFSFHST